MDKIALNKLILNKHDIMKMFSFSDSTLKRKIKLKQIPPPFQIGNNTSPHLWRASDIKNFIASRAKQTTTS